MSEPNAPTAEQVLQERDPYSLVLDALWALLEASPKFTALVREGNRIKLTGDNRRPMKAEVSTTDLPEVRIIVVSSTPAPFSSSSSHRDVVKWEIQISSGDQRLDALHFPLKWLVYEAMTEATRRLMEGVTFRGEQIVRSVRPVSVGEGVTQSDLNRGVTGWAALWGCETDLWFSRDAIRR